MLNSQQLDLQSPVKIDKWVDIDSEECKQLDPYRSFTMKCLRIGVESGFLHHDIKGRIWGYDPKRDLYYPFHFEVGKKLYGFRQSVKALN